MSEDFCVIRHRPDANRIKIMRFCFATARPVRFKIIVIAPAFFFSRRGSIARMQFAHLIRLADGRRPTFPSRGRQGAKPFSCRTIFTVSSFQIPAPYSRTAYSLLLEGKVSASRRMRCLFKAGVLLWTPAVLYNCFRTGRDTWFYMPCHSENGDKSIPPQDITGLTQKRYAPFLIRIATPAVAGRTSNARPYRCGI